MCIRDRTRTVNGTPAPLTGGPDGDTSVRTYAPPSAWGHTATFAVAVTDTQSGAVLTTRTLTIRWDSLPR